MSFNINVSYTVSFPVGDEPENCLIQHSANTSKLNIDYLSECIFCNSTTEPEQYNTMSCTKQSHVTTLDIVPTDHAVAQSKQYLQTNIRTKKGKGNRVSQ